jgi:hypothetical protein
VSVVDFSALKVEIFPNTGVLCDRMAWSRAKHSSSATQFARQLLVGVFDIETLLASTQRGGANKRDRSAEKKEALNHDCLQAIYC